MTPLLEQAIAALKTTSEQEQDFIATLILAEIADERCWQESFARSTDKLALMAAEALEEFKAVRVQPDVRIK